MNGTISNNKLRVRYAVLCLWVPWMLSLSKFAYRKNQWSVEDKTRIDFTRARVKKNNRKTKEKKTHIAYFLLRSDFFYRRIIGWNNEYKFTISIDTWCSLLASFFSVSYISVALLFVGMLASKADFFFLCAYLFGQIYEWQS